MRIISKFIFSIFVICSLFGLQINTFGQKSNASGPKNDDLSFVNPRTVFYLQQMGLKIEQIHLSNFKRLEKLFSVVIIDFVWVFKIRLFLHQNIKQIRMLSYGYKAKCFVKHGLERIVKMPLNVNYQDDIRFFNFLL